MTLGRRLAAVGPAQLPPSSLMRPHHRIRLVLEIVSVYVPAVIAMHRVGIDRLLAAARRGSRSRWAVAEAQRRETAVRLGVIVQYVFDLVPTDNRCLIRSTVLVQLLARRSIDSTLVIGVSMSGGFAAHAWVEYDDLPLLPVGAHEPLARL
jgi:hypothetical protein